MKSFRQFLEQVKQKNRFIDTSQIARLYDKADFAISQAIEWDEKFNKGLLFSRVNTIANLTENKYGLFNSALGKPDKKILLNKNDARNFPTNNALQKYPQLASPEVLKGYTIMVNVGLVLKSSKTDLEAIKKIGGIAAHEAAHSADFANQTEINPTKNVNLTETYPEQMRKAYEAWFDQNANTIMAKLKSFH